MKENKQKNFLEHFDCHIADGQSPLDALCRASQTLGLSAQEGRDCLKREGYETPLSMQFIQGNEIAARPSTWQPWRKWALLAAAGFLFLRGFSGQSEDERSEVLESPPYAQSPPEQTERLVEDPFEAKERFCDDPTKSYQSKVNKGCSLVEQLNIE